MPRVPFESAQVAPLQLPRMQAGYQPGAGEYIGKGLGEIAQTVQQIQSAYDSSLAHRSARDLNAEMQATVTKADQEIMDPEEFAKEATARVQETRRAGLDTVKDNYRVHGYVSDNSSDDLIKRQREISILKQKKLIDQEKGNFLLEQDRMQQDATKAVSIGDDKLFDAVYNQYQNRQAERLARGVIKLDDASKESLAFRDTAQKNGLAIFAASKPWEFVDMTEALSKEPTTDLEKEQRDKAVAFLSKFKGEDIQRSTEISDRVINAQINKAKEANKRESIDAERFFIDAAKNKNVDAVYEPKTPPGATPPRLTLKDAQIKYEWSEDKVNRIKRIEVGLTTSSPESDVLVANVLSDFYKNDNPTLGDVTRAHKRLLDLAPQVSLDSSEMRSAFRMLQDKKASLLLRGTIEGNRERAQENQLRSKAKERFRNYLRSNDPEHDDPAKNEQDKGNVFRSIDTSPGDQADSIVAEWEKQRGKKPDKTKELLDKYKGITTRPDTRPSR